MRSDKTLRTCGRALLAVALLAGLGACATGAKSEAMAFQTLPSAKPFPLPLRHAMCVRNVTGGEKTNPLWVSKVDSGAFQTALTSSLDNAGLEAASSACSYPIDINLLGLSQPIAGFDMTVTSHVNYKVYDSSGQPFVLTTIDEPYTANFSDAFAAATRLRLANEGSIRVSIEKFFDKLRDTEPGTDTGKTTSTGESVVGPSGNDPK